MLLIRSTALKHLLLAFSLLLFTNCKSSLAPAYDSIIVKKTSESTTKVLTLFASVDQGTTADTFKDREKTYNCLIGEFETLLIQAKARPVPSNKSLAKINKMLDLKGYPQHLDQFPSGFAFKRIIENLKKMKETDAKKGLKKFVVMAFKGEVSIFLDQAFTYESYLKR